MTQAVTKSLRNLLLASAGLLLILLASTIHVAPFHAFDGVMWANGGVHYINSAEVASRIKAVDAPYEAKMASSIQQSTPSCDSVDEGFCQQDADVYVYKTLLTPAVSYQPAVSDKKEVTGYCTLCSDGTFSPSCAVGRGACSWHGGVASYNVAEYITIPGTPAVQAQAAMYSYSLESYQDSPNYIKPETPSLETIVSH